MWSIFYWAPLSGFPFSYCLLILLLYFYQLHRFVKRGISSQIETCFSILSHVYSGHTFKLMSQSYVTLSRTRNEPLLYRVQKLENPDARNSIKRSQRLGQPEPGQHAACGLNLFSSLVGLLEAVLLPTRPREWWMFLQSSRHSTNNHGWHFCLCARKNVLSVNSCRMFCGWCLIALFLRNHLPEAGRERTACEIFLHTWRARS